MLACVLALLTPAEAVNVVTNQPITPALWNANKDRIIALRARVNEAAGFYPGMSCGAYAYVSNLGETSVAPCVVGGTAYYPQTSCPPGFSKGGGDYDSGSYYTCVKN